jgi:hypothetical protein
MRRVHLRGHDNILKRVLLHAGALNLGLLMRQLAGVGTPRSLQDRVVAVLSCLWSFIRIPEDLSDAIWTLYQPFTSLGNLRGRREGRLIDFYVATPFATGC